MIHNAIKNELPASLISMFSCMAVAEDVIKAARLTKTKGDEAFRLACPSDPLRDKSIDLYEAHVREICQRVKKQQDTRPATDAELLAVFSDTSLKAPLTQIGSVVMEQLFSKCFPNADLNADAAPREPWPGAVEETIGAARKKFTVETRR